MITARAARAAALVLTGTLLASGVLLVPSAWAATSDLSLEPGARGAALFSAGAMAPGHPVSRCVAVTASNASGSPVDVRLYARVGGALAPGLLLRVELGAGGSYDSCSGFTPRTPAAFTGTLAGFGDQHSDYTFGLEQMTATATYRFTVEVADDQQWQGLSATTQFLWEAQLDDPPAPPAPAPSPSPSPSPSVSPSPAPTPTGGPPSPAVPAPPGGPGTDNGTDTGVAPVVPPEPPPAPEPGELAAPVGAPPALPEAAQPAVATPAGPGAPPPAAPGTDVAIAPRPAAPVAPVMPLERPRRLDPQQPEQGALVRTATRVLEALRGTALVVGHAASNAARAAGMPFGLLALVVIFLITQDRIDRADPRLQLSPLHAPAMLEFLPADPA